MSEHARDHKYIEAKPVRDIGFRRVLHHGSNDDFVKGYLPVARQVFDAGRERIKKESVHLLRLLSDDRNLSEAWTHLSKKGGQAPGPDGYTYSDFDVGQRWACLRTIRNSIQAGTFVRHPETVKEILKPGKSGTRPLILQSIFDRVVQRATLQILEPLIDPWFLPFSYGFRKRPNGGTGRAVAMAEHLARHHDAWTWVSVDVKNAFPSVPIPRLLGVLKSYLYDDRLMEFLGVMLEPDKLPGLRQGAPASPLFQNLYLHHHVDWPWKTQQTDLPLIRFADDILLLCPNRDRAAQAYESLAKLMRDCGLTLKESPQEAIRSLDEGEAVTWMGFQVRREVNTLVVTIAERSWGSLESRFEEAHVKANSPLAAWRAIMGWVVAQAPCYQHEQHRDVYDRLRSSALKHGFSEIPNFAELDKSWELVNARWKQTRKAEKQKLAQYLARRPGKTAA